MSDLYGQAGAELLAALLESIGDAPRPSEDDGWFTVNDLAARAVGISKTQIRERLDKGVQAGTHEKVRWASRMFYRAVVK